MQENSSVLTTRNFNLRNLDMLDKENVFALFTDKCVMEFNEGKILKNLKEAENFIRYQKTQPTCFKNLNWAVTLKKTREFIGLAGFRNWDQSSFQAEIGAAFFSRYMNKGYGSELIDSLVAFGFNNMGLNRIIARIRPENKAAIQVVNNYDFQLEGVLRQSHFQNGNFNDVLLYSLLRDDIA
ncbi:GNAT family N-acetyltransferase [Pseudalkalibacillus sp. A8]|uniref:GNAT family N-acetyltransferase n=1 Tax=Pseudalkalibacillus sp. A8 TaxID=3382641 RepID=UPI0038B539B7